MFAISGSDFVFALRVQGTGLVVLLVAECWPALLSTELGLKPHEHEAPSRLRTGFQQTGTVRLGLYRR